MGNFLQTAQELVQIFLPAINFTEESKDAEGNKKVEKGRPLTKEETAKFKEFVRNNPEFVNASIMGELFANDGPKDPGYLELLSELEDLKEKIGEVNKRIKAEYGDLDNERIVMEAVTATTDGLIMAAKAKKKPAAGLPIKTVLDGKAPSRGRKKDTDSSDDTGDDFGGDDGEDEGDE